MKSLYRRYFFIIFGLIFLLSSAQPSFSAEGACAEYEAQAEAMEGVFPVFNKSGEFRAFKIYGEATFLFAKRSLISKARRKAGQKAKREFSEFMKSDFKSSSVAKDMMESVEKTDGTGKSEGSVEEIESQLNEMQENTSAVLSGLIKMDECVDPKEKVVLVTYGWKPSFAEAAADTKQKIKKEVSRGDQEPTSSGGAKSGSSRTRSSSSGGSVKRSNTGGCGTSGTPGVRVITRNVEGSGTNLKRATNSALRSAIAQVFGEQFASKSKSVDLTDQAEVSAFGRSVGVVLEKSSSREEITSKTKGIIQGYEETNRKKAPEGVQIFLRVKLAKYETCMDSSKSKAVVLPPKLSPSIRSPVGDMGVFNSALQDSIENILNSSSKLTILDRKFLKDQWKELSIVSAGNSPISELARLGNTVGADLIVISEIISYNQNATSYKRGNKSLTRTQFDAEISVKVINAATSRIIFSNRFPFKKKRIRDNNPASKFGKNAGRRLGGWIVAKLGGKNSKLAFPNLADVDSATKSVDKIFNEIETGVKNDW